MNSLVKQLVSNSKRTHRPRSNHGRAASSNIKNFAIRLLPCFVSSACAADDQEATATRPLSSIESHAALHPADGLEVEVVLVEPLVRQPVSITFDERGRMWVVQYLHPSGQKCSVEIACGEPATTKCHSRHPIMTVERTRYPFTKTRMVIPLYTSMGQLIWRYHPTTRQYEVFSEGGGNAFRLE